jgi:secondary thiamine-phosphate synthase enzyme
MKSVNISSNKHQDCIDITNQIKAIVKNSKISDGICFLYTPHATGGIIINENYDPNIIDDFLESISKLIPEGIWRHDRIDNNGASHIKSSIISPSEFIPIENNELKLGTWQNIMFTEFDGPRTNRKIYVKIIEG